MTSKETLGERIARARLALGATQGRFVSKADLADMVGLTGATVGNYEAGRTEPPYAILAALAKVLRVSPGWLAFGEIKDIPEDPKTGLKQVTRQGAEKRKGRA